MTTPEGVTKSLTKSLLAEYHIVPAASAGQKITPCEGWYYMPSQNGFGVKGVPDFIGQFRERFFAIETKKPKAEPTGLQALQIAEIRRSCSACFVVDGPESLEAVREWIHRVIDEDLND